MEHSPRPGPALLGFPAGWGRYKMKRAKLRAMSPLPSKREPGAWDGQSSYTEFKKKKKRCSNLHDFFLIISPFLPIFNVDSPSKLTHESNFASDDGF